MKEASQDSWNITVERIARKIKGMKKGQICKGWRHGTLQFHAGEVERDDFIHVMAATGDASPVAKGDCETPVGHGIIRITSYFASES